MAMESVYSAMTFSESSHENWTLIWYNLHRPQQLGNVDILVGKVPCPPPALSHGATERWRSRGMGKGEKKRRGERWEEPFYTPNPRVFPNFVAIVFAWLPQAPQ